MDGVVLAIDYGEKRIGLAVRQMGVSFPLRSIPRDGDYVGEIRKLVSKYDVKTVLVGYPIGLSGRETRMAKNVDEFVDLLRRHLPKSVEIIKVDERFSTRIGELLSDLYPDFDKDSLAALDILERFDKR